MTAEIRKLLAHRTPKVIAAVLLLAAVVPSLIMPYTSADLYTASTLTHQLFRLCAVLSATYFGAWVLGTEYRQHTIRRLLATDPVRLRVYARKLAAGLTIFGSMFAAVAIVGWYVSGALATAQGRSFSLYGPDLQISGVVAMAMLTMAFGLSAVGKGVALATVVPLGMVYMFGPLLSETPHVGHFTPGFAIENIVNYRSVASFVDFYEHSVSTSALVLTAWVTAFVAWGALNFHRSEA